jgi:hypothetical protein
MSSAAAVIIGEVLVGVIQIIAERAKAAGMTAEQVREVLADSYQKVLDTKPEDLPTFKEG